MHELGAVVECAPFQDTKLKIEIIPGNAICKRCNKVFNVIGNNSKFPTCRSEDWQLLSGKEFIIKEIIAY